MMDLDGPQLLALASVLMFVLVWTLWRRYYLLPVLECDAEAEKRAAALMREVLSDGESRELDQSGYLTVPSPSVPGRMYRIPAKPGWVDVYESGQLAMRMCVEPVERLPAADVVLMHKLMIEGNEPEYLRQANVVFVRPPAGRRYRRHHL